MISIDLNVTILPVFYLSFWFDSFYFFLFDLSRLLESDFLLLSFERLLDLLLLRLRSRLLERDEELLEDDLLFDFRLEDFLDFLDLLRERLFGRLRDFLLRLLSSLLDE